MLQCAVCPKLKGQAINYVWTVIPPHTHQIIMKTEAFPESSQHVVENLNDLTVPAIP
jgi:hypothetical protein